MKWISPFFLVVLALVSQPIGCSTKTEEAHITYYATRSDKIIPIFDPRGGSALCLPAEKTHVLSEQSVEINPWTGFSSGSFLVMVNDHDAIPYGNISYQTAQRPEGEITLRTFQRIGKGEKALGSDFEGKVWEVAEGKEPVLVAETDYKTVTTPEGETRTVDMFRLQEEGGEWMAVLDGMLARDSGDGRLEQVGRLSWRRIVMENGRPMAILMTKGMGARSRWAGRFNGVLYRDK